jgi:phosphoglycolate phosphatase
MSVRPVKPLSGVRAAIVDLDGTMVHTAPDFQVAINRMRADLGLAPLTVETVIDFVGKGAKARKT